MIADWGYGPVDICYLNNDTAMPTTAVVKESCSSTYAMFMTAMATGRTITSFHSVSTTCAAALPYSAVDHMPAEQPYGYHLNP